MEMEKEIMKKITAGEVTLADWKKYRNYFESLPRAATLAEMGKKTKNFSRIERLVVDKLSIEEISADGYLTVAYYEKTHPEMFESA